MAANYGCLFAAHPCTQGYGPQTEHQGESKVEGKDAEMSGSEQLQTLVAEGREGGEATTQSGGKQQPKFGAPFQTGRKAIE